MKPPTYTEKPTADALANALADEVANVLIAGIANTGSASLIVSGGSTPAPFFDALCQKDLEWSKVFVTLADERCVALDHADRNERMVRDRLMVNRAAPAQFVPLCDAAPDCATAAGRQNALAWCENSLSVIPRPYDVLILGMGEDAHTASLFPAAEGLATALNPANPANCQLIDPPSAPHTRMTLSLSALIDSRRVILHITGQAKRQVLEQALVDQDGEKAPIYAVLGKAQKPVDVYWSD